MCDIQGVEVISAISFDVDYQSIDPCIGCLKLENDLRKAYPELSDYLFNIMRKPFTFSEKIKVQDLNKIFKDGLSNDEFFLLDHIFRDLRAKTIRKLLNSNQYTVENFIEHD